MNMAMRHLAGLTMIGQWLIGAVNASYAQDACLDARVTASDGGVFQKFGEAVAISGETALIGAIWDAELGTESGAAYVFRREGGAWVEAHKLMASDGGGDDLFGFTIAIDGDLALIGAPGHWDANAPGNGSAFVFRLDPTTQQWIEEQELFASDGAFQDVFGFSVSVSGDVVVIGAVLDDDNGGNSGSAYVYRFDPKTQRWAEEQHLLASDGVGGDFFGQAVAVQGDVAVVTAFRADGVCGANCDSGAAYVFRYDDKTSTWIETQKLLASDGAPSDSFGESVALSDDLLVIGAHLTDDNGPNSGSAYVFRFDPKTSTWIEEQKLLASDGAGIDQMGRSVALDGQRIVVGAHQYDDVNSNQGAAYVFRYDPEASAWIEQAQLLPQPIGWPGGFFGRSVAVDGETAVIGASGENQLTGAAYMFNVSLNCNCPQDLDADGSVGASDLLMLLADWGNPYGASDLLELLAAWGPCL